MAGVSLIARPPDIRVSPGRPGPRPDRVTLVRRTIGVHRTIAVRCTRRQKDYCPQGLDRRGPAQSAQEEAVDEQDPREQAREARAPSHEAHAQAREMRARAREQRELARERRIAEHVSRGKERRLTQPPHRARGLTREDIVDAAIAVADPEGPQAGSMRRRAREMGGGATSLYWHGA